MKEIKELEIGEYVRDKNGNIDKIENYSLGCCVWHCVKGMCIDRCNTIGTHLTDIVKHSKNIIDLIETGDIVGLIDKDNKIHYYEVYDNTAMYQYQIKSIVTKEMMKSVEYRVETD